MSINRNTVVNLLKEGTVEIKFTKTDGSLRVLNGTLNEELTGVEVAANPTEGGALSVLDTNLGEYRAFRWESVKSVAGTAVNGL